MPIVCFDVPSTSVPLKTVSCARWRYDIKKVWLSENSKGRILLGIGETEKIKWGLKYRASVCGLDSSDSR
jgi:hypothetical protein